MAKTKPTPKPLFAIKGDFIDSLNRFCDQAVVLNAALQNALELDCIRPEGIAKRLAEHRRAFEAAMHDIGM